MPRVLFISHSAGLTGAPMMLLHLVKWLRANTRLEIHVLLKTGGQLAPKFSNITTTFIWKEKTKHKRRSLLEIAKKLFYAKDRDYNLPVFQASHTSYDLIYSNTITNGAILGILRTNNCPVITHVHELGHWVQLSGPDNLDAVKKHTTQYIAASEAVRHYLLDSLSIPPHQIDLVHEFINVSQTLPDIKQLPAIKKLTLMDERKFCVMGSGFEYFRKGKDLFIELARTTSEKLGESSIKFIWVGGWESVEEKSRIDKHIQRYKLQNVVQFVGEVSNPIDYFSICDVFAMVSREDPYPLVCLEAAALGKPVLCFDEAGGMPEFVEDDAGFVLPFLDVEAMAARLVELRGDPKLLARLGSNAFAKVRARHDVNVGASKVCEVIAHFLDSPLK